MLFRSFLQTFNARDLKQRLGVFQTTPSGRKGGIWQGGRGIATDGLGNIYLSTAGGSYDGVSNFGSSTLKLARLWTRLAANRHAGTNTTTRNNTGAA